MLAQPGVRYVVMGLGVNDILFPGFRFTPRSETVGPREIIAGYRRLIAAAHRKRIRMIGTTIPPFEDATFSGLVDNFYTPERERDRQTVNAWIRTRGAFDGVADLDPGAARSGSSDEAAAALRRRRSSARQ